MRLSVIVLALLAGCTGGSGDLPADASLTGTDWVEVELASGAVTALATPDARALAQPRWRTSHVLFRRIPAASIGVTTTGLPGGGEAEDQTAAASDGRSFLAVFELTGAQWAVLAGGGGSGDRPQTGLTADEVATVLAGMRLSRFRFDLPEAGLWAVACNGGRQALFSWGDGLAETAAGTYAVHHPRSGSAPSGPAAVGSLLPNALGIYDMHGNAWEMVRAAGGYEARGGAWDSPIMQCRVANVVGLPADLAVPTVGVRLALRP